MYRAPLEMLGVVPTFTVIISAGAVAPTVAAGATGALAPGAGAAGAGREAAGVPPPQPASSTPSAAIAPRVPHRTAIAHLLAACSERTPPARSVRHDAPGTSWRVYRPGKGRVNRWRAART